MTEKQGSSEGSAAHPALTRRGFLGMLGATVIAKPQAAPAAGPASRPASAPARRTGTRKDVPPQMSFIANEHVKLGFDLSVGGAITHLSPTKEPEKNLVNSWDLGRQIQMSYYAHPVPYTVPGHAGPPDNWKGLGWNPIQVGDDYGNPSKILEHRNDGRELYVKCIPMQWPLDNVPGECTFECWARLDGPAVRVRCRLQMMRSDQTPYPARTQEMPAVYTNGPWYRLFTYDGEAPFTHGPLSRIEKTEKTKFPWSTMYATEHWAALIDESDWGLGIWNPQCLKMNGGFAGKPGKGGPKDGPTGHVSPHRQEILDHNLTHEYDYGLVLGSLTEIRQWVYAQPRPPQRPAWTFTRDREGWHHLDARDRGWPLQEEYVLHTFGDAPQLIGPLTAWQAADAPRLQVEAAVAGRIEALNVDFGTVADVALKPARSVSVPVTADNVMRTYTADLASHPAYRGLIAQLRLRPEGPAIRDPGNRLRVRSIRLA